MSDGDSDPNAAHLVGFWDFLTGQENEDTGLADGIAQNGQAFGDAEAEDGALSLDGHKDYFSTRGPDDPFDLTEGTVAVRFTQGDQPHKSPAILVNRGEFNDRFQDGYFALGVTGDGRVTVTHSCGDARLDLTTADCLFDEGDEVVVTYGWSAGAGGTLTVENLSDGTRDSYDFDTLGLALTTQDDDGENFTFGARETREDNYAKFFEGEIDYVAVYDRDIVNNPVLGDGIVSGTDDADVIDSGYTGDPEGDRIDAGDAILPGEAPDDDIVDARAGDDIVRAGAGDDDIYAGAGSDFVDGGDGDDLIYGDRTLGGDPPDDPVGNPEREVLRWDLAPGPDADDPVEEGDSLAGGFVQNTGSVRVTFTARDAADAATTFADNDQNITGIEDDGDAVDENSSVESLLRGDGLSAEYEISFNASVTNVDFRINDIDGDGIVKVSAYDADGAEIPVTLTGGNRLTLTDTGGAAGADTADSAGGYNNDTSARYSLLVGIDGPVARIVITHSQDGDADTGVNFTDVYFNAPVPQQGDTIHGGDGDDIIFAEAGDDTVFGDAGNDVISGGAGADNLSGGDDRDRFIDLGAGDDVDGGDGGDDYDTLDLTGSAGDGTLTVTYTSDDREDGVVDYFDADGNATGQLVFEDIENLVGAPPICFTPGTLIATPEGERPVEDLRPGDRVITRDNGIQEICWKGQRGMTGAELALHPHHRPIRIRKGALGGGLPLRDMVLSPNHRVLVTNDKTALYFEENEVLVAAKHLTGLPGVETANVRWTTYIHVMCAQHEVLLSDGTWTESFQPGDYSLAGIGNAQRTELEHLFPELKTPAGAASFQAARRSLKKYEAQLLTRQS
ncbi:Hint domain-containing protein [Roseobacter sp. YSTF-M11]|uniref:Hint domain-containing protein n=1 Tax=Roseobacter insulae TaxID=2859783 RepID=A0A9X1K104_9RHOB|nr:Hint domain-containing protein [Roseobacter insulae]MBW4708734.1 Hint domain-containing protein [Roseobacter insulae]